MDDGSSILIERLVAQVDQVDALKAWLQFAAERIRLIPGVLQLELLQNQEKPAEFVFFLIVDDLPAVSKLLDQADWHARLVQELPLITVSDPERVVGRKIA